MKFRKPHFMESMTAIEWMVVACIVAIVGVVVVSNLNPGEPGAEMKRCAEKCGAEARPALLPAGQFGFTTCACLPPGVQVVPAPPIIIERSTP